jgi:DNA replication protein DnaC
VLRDNLRDAMSKLRLGGMLAAFDQQSIAPAFADMAFVDRLDHLLAAEQHERDDRMRERLFRAAKFKHPGASAAEVIFCGERGLERAHVAELLTGRWIRQFDNLLVSGPTGTGKSWLGCAIGVSAIQLGHSVRYVRTNPMLEEMRLAHGDGSIAKMRIGLVKVSLLILDDFGIAPINEQAKEDLLELLEGRIDNGATMVIGQLDPQDWHSYLDSPHLADAIMDRVVQRAHRLALRGPSMRERL